jgi:hypothetical protein
VIKYRGRDIIYRISRIMSLTKAPGEEIKEKITIFQGVGSVVSRGHEFKGYTKGKEISRIKVSMVSLVTNQSIPAVLAVPRSRYSFRLKSFVEGHQVLERKGGL